MKTIWHVSILCKLAERLEPGGINNFLPVWSFVTDTDEGTANFQAGACIDALADYHGRLYKFDYSVTAIAVAESTHEIVNLAVSKALI